MREEGARVSPLRGYFGAPVDVPGATLEDFGECNQLQGAFLPAYDYRPRGSAQYGLAQGAFAEGGDGGAQRWRLGLMAASDNHSARAGPGYKEFGRFAMTDGRTTSDEAERRSLFYYTGGLTAVHASGRDRLSIFEALERREVYGTSGGRMLLWFDWLGDDGTRRPMGSEIPTREPPRFEVRAVGAPVQRPGCPAFVREALDVQRIEELCLGECFHPAADGAREPIDRIEIVRIRPQVRPDEDVASLIDDPWLVLPCEPSDEGCRAEFADPDYDSSRETLYYARAIQRPTLVLNGDPLRCERDDAGRCVRARLCPNDEECSAPAAERAWSSPIWLQPEG
jgi:hypothetical protein